MQDYCAALRFYLSVPSRCIDRILFIENTASDLSALKEVAHSVRHDKQVEFITFQGNDFPPEYGRGHGEFRLLDYGLEHASCLVPRDVLWKVTGRLRVLNIAELVDTAPASYGIYCDLRRLPTFVTRVAHHYGRLHSYPWMELRLFSCRLRTYNQVFRGRYHDIRYDLTEDFGERTLYQVVTGLASGEHVVPRLRIQPRFSGLSGFRSESYDWGIERVRSMVRGAARRVVPWLWL